MTIGGCPVLLNPLLTSCLHNITSRPLCVCCKDEGPATGGTGVCEFGVRAAYEFPRAVSVAGASGVSVPDAEVCGGLSAVCPICGYCFTSILPGHSQ